MIADRLVAELLWDGRKLRLNLAFDVVLRVFRLQKDQLFDDTQKLELSIRMLVRNYRRVRNAGVADKGALLRRIFSEFLFSGGKSRSDGPKLVDFEQDAEYIFASFWQAYGINLAELRGELDWRLFCALFRGLPVDTKIREIMEIRGRPYPAPTKYNAAEIKALREAKAYYALKVNEGEAEEQFQHGLARLAGTLEKIAGGGTG